MTQAPPASRPLPDQRRQPDHCQHVRELLGLPPEWRWVSINAEGKHPNYWGVTVEGGICPPKTRGPNKGRPNWKAATMVRKFTLTNEQHEAWLVRWEAEEGKCLECEGTGERFTGWNHETGHRYEPCRRCDATGLPAALRTAAA